MVNLMRKYRQGLLTVITVIIIISFAWLYNDYRLGGRGDGGSIGSIYGRELYLTDYQRGLRRFQMCQELGLFELLGGLAGSAQTKEQAETNFVFGAHVLRHEAEALGLRASDQEVIDSIKTMPPFQTNGAFDSSKYAIYTQRLASFGFTVDQIEDAVRDNLKLQKLKELVGTTISAPTSELRAAFEEENQKMEVSYVTIKEGDLAKEIQINDEDLKKAFEERKSGFKTDQLRTVKYVALVLNDEEKKLQGKDRAAALQKLVDKASDFSVAMTVKDAKFEEVAEKAGLKVGTTPAFSRGAPPAELGRSSAATAAAFDKTTEEQRNSDPIASERRDGYYILQLVSITPSRDQTFDEVKAGLTETLKRERLSEKLAAKASEVRTKLQADIKAGKSFADAAQAVNLPVEKLPAFSAAEPPKQGNPAANAIQRTAPELTEGSLSDVLPIPAGRIVFHVDKRLPIDEAAFEKEKSQIAENFSRGRAESAFRLWFDERVKASNLQSKLAQPAAPGA